MKDEERGELKEDEEDSDEKNHSLSREGWIMLLSGEINKEEMKLTSYWNVCIVILIAFLGAEVAFLVAGFQSGVVIHYILVLAMFIFLALTIIYKKCYLYPRVQERVKPLINTREAIISGKLTDFNKIHEEWKKYMENCYKNYLKDPEMNEAKEKIKEGKENSKEMDLEKNFKEQKEVLQAMQRDMSDIKRRMEEIAISNSFCVFGSLLVAGGLMILTLPKYPPLQCLQWIAGFTAFVIGLIFIVVGCIRNVAKMQLKRKINNRKT